MRPTNQTSLFGFGVLLFLTCTGCGDTEEKGSNPRDLLDVSEEVGEDSSTDTGEDSSFDDSSSDAVPDVPNVAMVGAEGGQVVSPDGMLTLTIPAGALDEDTEIRVDVVNDEDLPGGHVGEAFHLQPDGTLFEKPVTISLDYGMMGLSDVEGAELSMATYTEGDWAAVVDGWTDVVTRTVNANVRHFSYWAAIPSPLMLGPYDACGCGEIPFHEPFRRCCLDMSGRSVSLGRRCSCVHDPDAYDQYRFLDCVEQRARVPWGGCTKPERDCCENVSTGYAHLTARDGRCFCSYISACGPLTNVTCEEVAEQQAELGACLADTRVCGKDLTACERLQMAVNPVELTGGQCVDIWSDPEHCGGEGMACNVGESCVFGQCACPGGTTSCPSGCTDLQTDAANCGECSVRCQGGESCEGGTCQCTADTNNDVRNCGACGNACPPGSACEGGECQDYDCASLPCHPSAHGLPCCVLGNCAIQPPKGSPDGPISCSCEDEVWTCTQE